MTKQAQAKWSALLYSLIPTVTIILNDTIGNQDTVTHIIAAVVAVAAVFGINLSTGDKTAGVGGAKPDAGPLP